MIGDAKVAYNQFLHRTRRHSTPSFTELHKEFTKLFEEYLSPEAANGELKTLQWDLCEKSPEQFVSKIRQLCSIIYPCLSSWQQDRESGTRLMTLLPVDIESLVRKRAGITDDIVKLHTTLINVLSK